MQHHYYFSQFHNVVNIQFVQIGIPLPFSSHGRYMAEVWFC